MKTCIYEQQILDSGTTADYAITACQITKKFAKECLEYPDRDAQASRVVADIRRIKGGKMFAVFSASVMGDEYVCSVHASERAAVVAAKKEVVAAVEHALESGGLTVTPEALAIAQKR